MTKVGILNNCNQALNTPAINKGAMYLVNIGVYDIAAKAKAVHMQ